MLGSALVVVCAVTPAASRAATRNAASSMMIQGTAGSSVDVVLPKAETFVYNTRPQVLATADRGDWAGVVVVSADDPRAGRPYLLSVSMSERLRCPGSKCPYTDFGPPLIGSMDTDGNVRLPAGRYHVVLAGPTGSHVTATLHPMGATRSTLTFNAMVRSARVVSALDVAAGPVGHETALHAYHSVAAGGTWAVATLFDAWALSPAGLVQETDCVTLGPQQVAFSTVGGVAPCTDPGGGQKIVFGPAAEPASDGMGYGRVAVSATAVSGRPDTPIGVGSDAQLVAPSSYLRSLFLAVTIH